MKLTEGTNKLAKALLLPINPSAVIILGVYTMLWGAWVGNPFWTVFTQAPLFDALAHVAPEVFWGCLAMTCGAVTIYGALRRRYRPLVVGASVCGWHWFMISIFYFIGDALNTGGISALVFAVYAAFVYLNIRVNFKNNKKSPHILETRAPPYDPELDN